MRGTQILQRSIYIFSTLCLIMASVIFTDMEALAVEFPGIQVTFDTGDESVIVEGIPANSADGTVEYQLEGYLNYEKERIETFCYAPNVRSYDVPGRMAYIFNWSGDAEFLLPCTGEYRFTAYVTARHKDAQGNMTETEGPKTTISITLHKQDESTNWGPGLPNTTVETYDLNQIKGKDKTIRIEEAEYTWRIHGTDIVSVPDLRNFSLKITEDPEMFDDTGVEAFFGDTLARKFNIEYSGEFGFSANLDYKLGAEYAGKYASLFYVAGEGVFEYIGGSVVGEDGVANFVLTHASDYVIAVTEEEYTGQELNPPIETVPETETAKEAETVQESERVQADSKADPEPAFATYSGKPVIGGIIFLAAIAIAVFRVKKK